MQQARTPERPQRYGEGFRELDCAKPEPNVVLLRCGFSTDLMEDVVRLGLCVYGTYLTMLGL